MNMENLIPSNEGSQDQAFIEYLNFGLNLLNQDLDLQNNFQDYQPFQAEGQNISEAEQDQNLILNHILNSYSQLNQIENQLEVQPCKERNQGDKLSEIQWKIQGCSLETGELEQFSSWFEGINFPGSEQKNYFLKFFLFKQQLQNQLPLLYFSEYLIKVSLTFAKYYFIYKYFQEIGGKIKSSDFVIDFVIVLRQCKNDFADLLQIIYHFMRGQEIFHTHQNIQRWQKFSQMFNEYHSINKNFYKSHNCNYRKFIVQTSIEQGIDEEWFNMRNDQFLNSVGRARQSNAGQKDFEMLMDREQEKYQKGIISNIGYFTLAIHFDYLNQHKLANSLIYADDIFNVIIKYNIII